MERDIESQVGGKQEEEGVGNEEDRFSLIHVDIIWKKCNTMYYLPNIDTNQEDK